MHSRAPGTRVGKTNCARNQDALVTYGMHVPCIMYWPCTILVTGMYVLVMYWSCSQHAYFGNWYVRTMYQLVIACCELVVSNICPGAHERDSNQGHADKGPPLGFVLEGMM